jgi:anti-anti-sigma factor
MPVEYEYNEKDRSLSVSVIGHFNFSLVSEFRSIYSKVKDVNDVTIDLEQTDVIDSSGLGILLYLQKHYSCSRENLKLVNCNSAITKTFNMAQFKKLFIY